MPTLDEQLDAIIEEFDVPEDRVAPFRRNKLVEELERFKAEAAKVPDLEKKVDGFEKAPVRQKAFEDAKVDFDQLTVAEREAIENFSWDGDKPDAEKVAEFIQKYQLPQNLEGEVDEKTGAEKVAEQAQDSTRRGLSGRTKVDAEVASQWSPDVWMKFETEHPELARKVLDGEEVTTTFSP